MQINNGKGLKGEQHDATGVKGKKGILILSLLIDLSFVFLSGESQNIMMMGSSISELQQRQRRRLHALNG